MKGFAAAGKTVVDEAMRASEGQPAAAPATPAPGVTASPQSAPKKATPQKPAPKPPAPRQE
jgi:hypothetical protein